MLTERAIRSAQNTGSFLIIISKTLLIGRLKVGDFIPTCAPFCANFALPYWAFCTGWFTGGNAMKICMVGSGAFAKKHLDGLARIKDAEVVTIYGRSAETTEAAAKKYGIPHWTTNMDEALARPGVEAAILTSPTQVHAEQAIKVMRAGK